MKLEKGLLRQLFGFCGVAHHAKAHGPDPLRVLGIELGKRILITGLGAEEWVFISDSGAG
jgi:hypothetical protein